MATETLPEKVKDRDFIIAVLCVVIILLLLYWRHVFVTSQGSDDNLPDVNIPVYTFPTDGIVMPKPGRDWGQSTDLACGCDGDDFYHGGPILSPPTYIYVSTPPPPHFDIPALAPMPPAPTLDLPHLVIPTYTFWFDQAYTTKNKQQDVIKTSDGKILRLKDDQTYSFKTYAPNDYVIDGNGDIIMGARRYSLDASKNDFGPLVNGQIYLHAGIRYRQSVLQSKYRGHEDAEWHNGSVVSGSSITGYNG